MDREGGAVSVTLTLNTWFGSGVVARGTGVLLNCDMDDFTRADRRPNFFGLEQGVANRIAPGKRMASAMAPTMVLGNRGPDELLLILGSPGGATIATTVFQVISHIADAGLSPSEAIAQPRFHHQHLPDRIECEPGGVSGELAESLMDRGHQILEREEFIGDVQMIAVEPDGGCTAISDPRRGGRPRAV
jgi:gamma-glutamyltranspeptidase/glutathione hydrolase